MNAWKRWYARYERWLVTGTLIAGFLFHYVTFRALDVWTMLIWLFAYLCLAAAGIAFVCAVDGGAVRFTNPRWQRVRVLAPLVIQFSFGSLLSMVLLFYWFSGALGVSWPILLFLLASVVVNEVFPHLYANFLFQMSVLFLALFCYCSVLFPYAFHSISAWMFFGGGLVSVVILGGIAFAIVRLVPKFRAQLMWVGLCCFLLFGMMTGLYLTDLTPPVPLSLRDGGIYHNVQRISGTYQLDGEPESFWERMIPGQMIHERPEGRVYAFSAVYAPKGLDIRVYHEWQYYDAGQDAWVTVDRLSFPMVGGSDRGYRGYTFKTRLRLGEWRVNVETESGHVIGRIPFRYIGR